MNQNVFLICGVQGSGKTWVCGQLKDKFEYVPHDEFFKDLVTVLFERSQIADKPMITECPFGERLIRSDLEDHGLNVHPFFVVDSPEVIKARFEMRENKPFPRSAYTRSLSIVNRAMEWNAPYGPSDFIYQVLYNLDLTPFFES